MAISIQNTLNYINNYFAIYFYVGGANLDLFCVTYNAEGSIILERQTSKIYRKIGVWISDICILITIVFECIYMTYDASLNKSYLRLKSTKAVIRFVFIIQWIYSRKQRGDHLESLYELFFKNGPTFSSTQCKKVVRQLNLATFLATLYTTLFVLTYEGQLLESPYPVEPLIQYYGRNSQLPFCKLINATSHECLYSSSNGRVFDYFASIITTGVEVYCIFIKICCSLFITHIAIIAEDSAENWTLFMRNKIQGGTFPTTIMNQYILEGAIELHRILKIISTQLWVEMATQILTGYLDLIQLFIHLLENKAIENSTIIDLGFHSFLLIFGIFKFAKISQMMEIEVDDLITYEKVKLKKHGQKTFSEVTQYSTFQFELQTYDFSVNLLFSSKIQFRFVLYTMTLIVLPKMWEIYIDRKLELQVFTCQCNCP